MKKYHFISGLPRSGSTLLTSILNQNPDFNSNISNPLARFVRAIITEPHASPGYALQCPEKKQIELIQNLISTYYSDVSANVCFNTNRGWTNLLQQLEKVSPDSKVICCVRDIPWILDSFERLFKSNPFQLSNMYSSQEVETVYSRSYALMTPGHTVSFAYDSLKEAITGPQKHNVMLVDYEQLAKYPENTMRAIYNFIGEPYFNHDFDNVETMYEEYDLESGISELHTIRKKVEFIERPSILPPDLFNHFNSLSVWK